MLSSKDSIGSLGRKERFVFTIDRIDVIGLVVSPCIARQGRVRPPLPFARYRGRDR